MLYLHCGWVRTGTTSLQSAIIGCRDELAAADIVYPDEWRHPGATDHHGLVDILHSEEPKRRLEVERFQDQLRALPASTVMLSSESLSHTVGEDRRAALLNLLSAARAVMPITQTWTLRNFSDAVRSVYHRFALSREAAPSPADYMRRIMTVPRTWPEEMFRGMRMLQDLADDTVYLKYRPDGSHSRNMLDVMRVPAKPRGAIERQMDERPRLNTRLTHKGAVAVQHIGEVEHRTGISIERERLVSLLIHGQLRFEGDHPCNLFDEDTVISLHEHALAAARCAGFSAYSEFFENEGPEASDMDTLDADVLTDRDLDYLAARLEPAQALS